MRARAGDRIILAGEQVDQPTRAGEVLEARGPDGGPPYVVRWEDGHTSTMFPGPGAVLRVTNSSAGWDGSPGDHIILPRVRHGLHAVEDSVVLLTVAKPVGPHV